MPSRSIEKVHKKMNLLSNSCENYKMWCKDTLFPSIDQKKSAKMAIWHGFFVIPHFWHTFCIMFGVGYDKTTT